MSVCKLCVLLQTCHTGWRFVHYHARIDTDSGYVDRMDITVHL